MADVPNRDLVETIAIAMLRIEMAPTLDAVGSDAIVEAAGRRWLRYTEFMREGYRARARVLLAEIVPLITADAVEERRQRDLAAIKAQLRARTVKDPDHPQSSDYLSYIDGVVADFAAAQNAELEAAVAAIGVDPSELMMTSGYVDGRYQVDAWHVPSGISVTVADEALPVRALEDSDGERVMANVRNLPAEAFRQLKRALSERIEGGRR